MSYGATNTDLAQAFPEKKVRPGPPEEGGKQRVLEALNYLNGRISRLEEEVTLLGKKIHPILSQEISDSELATPSRGLPEDASSVALQVDSEASRIDGLTRLIQALGDRVEV